jgi:hypothetical protein
LVVIFWHYLTPRARRDGRRRLGKTTLLLGWAQRTNIPAIYWVASRVTAVQLLRSFLQAVYNHLHHGVQANVELTRIERAGNNAPLERPEEVMAIMRRFLTQTGAGTG